MIRFIIASLGVLLTWIMILGQAIEPEPHFRNLQEVDEQNFAHLNHSMSQRRLASDYLSMINNVVTQSKLAEIIRKNKYYLAGDPFPYMTETNLFPQEVLNAIHLEIPDNPTLNKKNCVLGARCYDKPNEKGKNAFAKSKFGPATTALFAFMQSIKFINFLEELTGIGEIIPDKSFKGAGVHQTLSGGHLGVHADFNLNRKKMLHRRVNVFVYANPDWKEEYGGHLELWSRDLTNCTVKIAPDLGRLVVFSTTDFSYHGHQSPLRCSADRSRRSLAMYYYTKSRPSYECIDNNCFGFHTTLFQKTLCPECSDSKCYGNRGG